MQIVNFYYELARQNKRVNGFIYNAAYNKGIGHEAHPLVWLDDPITGRQADAQGAVQEWTVNMDVLGIPKNEAQVEAVQSEMFSIGLSIIEKARQVRKQFVRSFAISSYTFVSLRNYYDNDAAGFRFTMTVTAPNPVNICADDYDPDKQLLNPDGLPDFSTDNPSGCAIFSSSMPPDSIMAGEPKVDFDNGAFCEQLDDQP